MSARLNEITYDMSVLSIQKIELSNMYILRKGKIFLTKDLIIKNKKNDKVKYDIGFYELDMQGHATRIGQYQGCR
jgi:hypothetical protein